MRFKSYALDCGYWFFSYVQGLKKGIEENLQSFDIENYARTTVTNQVFFRTYQVWFNIDLKSSCFGVFIIYLGYRKDPREEVPVGWKYPTIVARQIIAHWVSRPKAMETSTNYLLQWASLLLSLFEYFKNTPKCHTNTTSRATAPSTLSSLCALPSPFSASLWLSFLFSNLVASVQHKCSFVSCLSIFMPLLYIVNRSLHFQPEFLPCTNIQPSTMISFL